MMSRPGIGNLAGVNTSEVLKSAQSALEYLGSEPQSPQHRDRIVAAWKTSSSC